MRKSTLPLAICEPALKLRGGGRIVFAAQAQIRGRAREDVLDDRMKRGARDRFHGLAERQHERRGLAWGWQDWQAALAPVAAQFDHHLGRCWHQPLLVSLAVNFEPPSLVTVCIASAESLPSCWR
jgi:hypothetical protein